MTSDFSRWSFDPWRDFSAVLSQQGRVDTDADRNEWVSIVARRIQAGVLDALGRAVVPRETPDGFRIEAAGGNLTIGRGRIYVDGLLAENHGGAPLALDPHLAELVGTEPVAYADQPYLKNPPALPGGGPHVVYLKVWNREVTHIEDPRLVEKALGVDTTSRAQTVWQVKLLANVGAGVTCQTPLEEIPGFTDAEPAAAARLTSKTVEVPGEPDPCEVPPTGGYKGLENQLYRVEIHRGGDFAGADRATFKWSRDNATVASRVRAIPALDRVVVDSVGRDALLRFADGDWIEITDDWRELAGLPGEIRRIRAGNGVDDATRTILLEQPLPAATFPVDAQGKTDPARNTRVRRWDQSHRVRDENGNTIVDLDAPGATGEIPVPAAGTFGVLENGVAVAFHPDPASGRFRTGDHWLIAARTADASIEILDRAPPRGIHAHHAKLAIVTFPETETGCRVLWPPEAGEKGCDCTVCVSAESHASGTLTIQAAIEQAKQTGGTVCLGPGTYDLREPLRILNARALRLRGQGWATVLVAAAGGEAIQLADSMNVACESFAVVTAAAEGGTTAITLTNGFDVTLERLLVFNLGVGDRTSAAVTIDGYAFDVQIAHCLLGAGIGIQGGRRDDGYLLTAGLRIIANTFVCAVRGVSLERFAIHAGDTRVEGNGIRGCREIGIAAIGGVIPGGTFDIQNNLLEADASGIVVGTDGLRIAENDIRARPGELAGDGIALVHGLDASGIDHARILANRVRGVRGHGIALRTRINSGMIKMNVISEAAGGGIIMEGDGEAGELVVDNNQLLGVGLGGNVAGLESAAMRFVGARALDVRANGIVAFAREARQSRARTAILAVASQCARITGNRVAGIAPVDGFVGEAIGIGVIAPFREATVADNTVRRRADDADKLMPAEWVGIGVRGRVDGATPDDRFGFIPLGDIAVGRLAEAVFVFHGSNLRAAVAPSAGEVAVRANEVESELSTASPVVVAGAMGCRIADNRVALLPFEATDKRFANPSIVRARRAIVSSNDLRGPGGPEAEVLRVRRTGKGEVAIVGNLRSGVIVLDDAPLGDPWAPLNPLSPE